MTDKEFEDRVAARFALCGFELVPYASIDSYTWRVRGHYMDPIAEMSHGTKLWAMLDALETHGIEIDV